MNKHLKKLPSFRSTLTPEQRADFDALTPDQREGFISALATGMLIRELPQAGDAPPPPVA